MTRPVDRSKPKPKPKPPPSGVNYPGYTGIWMGWYWLKGKPIKPAPPVSR